METVKTPKPKKVKEPIDLRNELGRYQFAKVDGAVTVTKRVDEKWRPCVPVTYHVYDYSCNCQARGECRHIKMVRLMYKYCGCKECGVQWRPHRTDCDTINTQLRTELGTLMQIAMSFQRGDAALSKQPEFEIDEDDDPFADYIVPEGEED